VHAEVFALVREPQRWMAALRKGTRRERNQRLRSPADLPEGTWKQSGSATEPVDGCFVEGCQKREKSVTSVIDPSHGKHLETERFKNQIG
jgi:hypothetical protein